MNARERRQTNVCLLSRFKYIFLSVPIGTGVKGKPYLASTPSGVKMYMSFCSFAAVPPKA